MSRHGDLTEAARAARELSFKYGLNLVDGDIAALRKDFAHARHVLSGLLELFLDVECFFDLMFEDKIIPDSQRAKQALLNRTRCVPRFQRHTLQVAPFRRDFNRFPQRTKDFYKFKSYLDLAR